MNCTLFWLLLEQRDAVITSLLRNKWHTISKDKKQWKRTAQRWKTLPSLLSLSSLSFQCRGNAAKYIAPYCARFKVAATMIFMVSNWFPSAPPSCFRSQVIILWQPTNFWLLTVRISRFQPSYSLFVLWGVGWATCALSPFGPEFRGEFLRFQFRRISDINSGTEAYTICGGFHHPHILLKHYVYGICMSHHNYSCAICFTSACFGCHCKVSKSE